MTVYNHQKDRMECFEQIIGKERDTQTVQQASGLLRLLEDEFFLYWLNFFKDIMPHVAILYYQLQTRGIDSIKIQRAVDTFKQQILLVRNKIRVEDAGPSTYIYWLLFLAVRNKYCSIYSRTVGSK
jgi:hypothetical protein